MGTMKFYFYLFIFLQVQSHRGRRSEPAGLHGLRKQVTEAEEGPWELRREQGREKAPGEGEGCSREAGAEGGCREIECWNTVLELVWGFIFVYIL